MHPTHPFAGVHQSAFEFICLTITTAHASVSVSMLKQYIMYTNEKKKEKKKEIHTFQRSIWRLNENWPWFGEKKKLQHDTSIDIFIQAIIIILGFKLRVWIPHDVCTKLTNFSVKAVGWKSIEKLHTIGYSKTLSATSWQEGKKRKKGRKIEKSYISLTLVSTCTSLVKSKFLLLWLSVSLSDLLDSTA